MIGRISHHLLRSDHAPFWRAGLPALMWTDTAEFRNPHYHRATDTPETLDYVRAAAPVQKLLAPSEMGELFKVLALARSEMIAWPGFALADRRHRL